MQVLTVQCNICERMKQETNHWLKSVEKPNFEGILFLPADAAQDPPVAGYRYSDICGQACAHVKFSQWLDDLNNINFPTKQSEAA